MNFVALVSHGLSAISVFGDVVGVRLLIASLAASLLAALGIVLVVMIKFLTDWAIPGWATYATGTLVMIMIQFITIATSFTFFVLSNRTNLGLCSSAGLLIICGGGSRALFSRRDLFPSITGAMRAHCPNNPRLQNWACMPNRLTAGKA